MAGVAGITVNLTPATAEVVRSAGDRRFSKGAITGAVRWAAGSATSATVVELALDADPPMLVAELLPAGARLALYAGEARWMLQSEWVRRIAVPAGLDELDWLVSTLTAAAGIAAPTEPEAPETYGRSRHGRVPVGPVGRLGHRPGAWLRRGGRA